MKKILIILGLIMLLSFGVESEQQKRDCQTSEASQFNSGGYVSGYTLYIWERRGQNLVITRTIEGNCGDLKQMAASHNWIYIDNQ